MDINDLFDGIMKSINQFADEIAEQRLQEKMQETGRGPENGGLRMRRILRRKRLRRLGLSFTRIAEILGVTDKTVAKAARWWRILTR